MKCFYLGKAWKSGLLEVEDCKIHFLPFAVNESAPLCGDLLTRIAATISLDVNVLLHAEAGPVDDDVDEVEGQPGEEGDQDDADEEEESLLAPPVTFGVRSGPERELGELQIYPGIVHQ